MQHADLAYIDEHLDAARNTISLCGDILTGRDTYPLVADKIVEPFAFYLAIEIERMMGAITQMHNNVKQEAEEAKQLETWEAEQKDD